MPDAVVYHNPDSMGFSARDVTVPSVLTNKPVSDSAIGTRVWLLTGEGQPRRFFIRAVFRVTRVESGEEEGFVTMLSGERGQFFSPMVDITNEEWFRDFLRSQGNFAFGYHALNDRRFISGLEAAIDQKVDGGRSKG